MSGIWRAFILFNQWLKKIEDKVIKISGQDYIPALFSLEWILVGLSHLYGIGVGFRLWLYQKKIFHSKELPCFVISIGNIVCYNILKEKPTLIKSGLGRSTMRELIARGEFPAPIRLSARAVGWHRERAWRRSPTRARHRPAL